MSVSLHSNGVNPSTPQSPNGSSREKLELLTGKPTTMRLVYGQPQEGEGRYGKWFRYSVDVDGKRLSWFPPHLLVEALTQHGARDGSVLTITREEFIRDGKRKGFYLCELDGKRFEVINGKVVTTNRGNGNGNGQPKRTREEVKANTDALYGDDHYHAVSHGYGLTQDDVTPPEPQRVVRLNFAGRELVLDMVEYAELCEVIRYGLVEVLEA